MATRTTRIKPQEKRDGTHHQERLQLRVKEHPHLSRKLRMLLAVRRRNTRRLSLHRHNTHPRRRHRAFRRRIRNWPRSTEMALSLQLLTSNVQGNGVAPFPCFVVSLSCGAIILCIRHTTTQEPQQKILCRNSEQIQTASPHGKIRTLVAFKVAKSSR